jgi:3-methyladenine DNA glycosylase AlkD
METQLLIQEMESLGTEQNRKIYRRHGVHRDQYGLSFANLKKLQKRIKKDHQLAQELWATSNHDCRILATMIADPAQGNDNLLEGWCRGLDNYVISDAFSGYVGQTALAQPKAERWTQSEEEWPGRLGWRLISILAMQDQHLPDSYFEACIETIEREIHGRKNMVRDAMNSALIAIGIRNSHLEELALSAAQRIGKVEVEHGKTNCKTPDAAAYIRRTLDYRQSRQKSKAS